MNRLKKLVSELRTDPVLKSKFEENPLKFLEETKIPHPIWDKTIFLIVVSIVSFALLGSMIVAAIIVLDPGKVVNGPNNEPILLQKDIDEFFIMIASAALGALVGLLAPKPDNE